MSRRQLLYSFIVEMLYAPSTTCSCNLIENRTDHPWVISQGLTPIAADPPANVLRVNMCLRVHAQVHGT